MKDALEAAAKMLGGDHYTLADVVNKPTDVAAAVVRAYLDALDPDAVIDEVDLLTHDMWQGYQAEAFIKAVRP